MKISISNNVFFFYLSLKYFEVVMLCDCSDIKYKSKHTLGFHWIKQLITNMVKMSI